MWLVYVFQFIAIAVVLSSFATLLSDRRRRRAGLDESPRWIVKPNGDLQLRPASNTARLRLAARDGRRHADEYGFPYAVWDLLEAFWSLDEPEPPAEVEKKPAAKPVEPFDLDAFVARTRKQPQPCLDKAELDAEIARLEREIVRSAGLPPAHVSDRPVEIVNGAGRVITTYDADPIVRRTWPLAGTAEDDHVLAALRVHGVRVGIETTDIKRAHLVGKTSAITAAELEYRIGWRRRCAQMKETS